MSQFVWSHSRLTQGRFHRPHKSQTGSLIRPTTSIAARTSAKYLRVDLSTTCNSVFIAFHHERCGTFSNHGTFAFEVKWSAGPLRIVRSPRQAFKAVELCNVHRMNVGTACSYNHAVGSIRFDHTNGFGQCQQRRCITTGNGIIRTTGIVVD